MACTYLLSLSQHITGALGLNIESNIITLVSSSAKLDTIMTETLMVVKSTEESVLQMSFLLFSILPLQSESLSINVFET